MIYRGWNFNMEPMENGGNIVTGLERVGPELVWRSGDDIVL